MDKKWNLQDIKPNRVKKESKKPVPPKVTRPQKNDESPTLPVRTKKRSYKSYALIGLVLIASLVGGLVYNALNACALIEVEPRQQSITLNGTFTASKQPSANELGYEEVSVQEVATVPVATTGQEEVSEQATGRLVIRNTTNRSERLIKNTRFESPEGLVYRITESVVVPGASVEGTPGTVEVDVFATEAGELYNLEAGVNFTIPGYAENGFDNLFASITASNPVAFTGGFEGVQYILEEDELENAKSEAERTLSASLEAQLREAVPSTLYTFATSTQFEYKILPTTPGDEDAASVVVEGIASIPAFLPTELASFLADASIVGYEGQPVRLDGLEQITFERINTSTSTSATADVLTFSLKGDTTVTYTFDEEGLKADLAGKEKTAMATVLSGYPAILKGKATLRPFWRQQFPTDTNRIEIVEIANN